VVVIEAGEMTASIATEGVVSILIKTEIKTLINNNYLKMTSKQCRVQMRDSSEVDIVVTTIEEEIGVTGKVVKGT
jgi:hypothetical protein